MAKLVINDVTSGFYSTTALNNVFTAIEAAIENTVSRDGTAPNQMTASLDMNGQSIINAGEVYVGGVGIAANVAAAASNAASALASATSASVSAASALASEIAATAVAGQLVNLDYVGTWVTATLYKVNNIVYEGSTGSSYICLVQHTSGIFNTDYTVSGYWGILAAKGSAGAGTGDVVGPAASTNNSLARFDGVTGKLLKDGAVIGVDVQAYDATLTALAGTLTAANKIPYATALDTAGELDLSTDVALGVSNTTLSTQGAIKSYVDTKADNLVVNATTAVPDQLADYLIFEDATDSTQKKALVSAFNTLVSGTTVVTTTGTTHDFTGIPSWVKKISILFKVVSTNGTSAPIIQLGTGGVPEVTNYIGSVSVIATTVASNNLSSGFPITTSNTAAFIHTGCIDLYLQESATNTWVATGHIGRSDAATTSIMGGYKSLAGTLDMIRLTTSGGVDTFDAGSINILYE